MKIEVTDRNPNENKLIRAFKDIVFKKIAHIDTDAIANEVAIDIARRAKYNLIAEGSVVTRQLYNSVHVNKITDGHYAVIADAPYAKIYEHGMGFRGDQTYPNPPAHVNVYAIQEWIMNKSGMPEKDAKSLAFAIANVMKKEGLYPHPFMSRAVKHVKADMKMKKKLVAKVAIEGVK